MTGSESLDQINRELGVRSARSLFINHHGGNGGRRAAYFDRLNAARQRFAARSARVAAPATLPDLSNVFVVELPPSTDLRAAAAQYAANPDVEYAEPDYEVRASFTPNDPFLLTTGSWGQSYPDLWGLDTTQAALAWDTANGSGTVVAVIDTGVDHTHPDLSANMWTNPNETLNGVDDDLNGFVDDTGGWDFDQSDNTPYDEHGHGTHVAGTVAAVGNNGLGVVGIAWGARIMAVRGLDADGKGYASDLAEAIVYAAENGADVLNNSWGGSDMSQTLVDAVDTAVGLGAVVVASAGNDGANYVQSPAVIPGVIAVGATDPGDVRASFSNFGRALSVTAPGVDILSLRGAISNPVGGAVVADDYLRLSGTSMAAPHVAGLAAVLLSAQSGLTPEEVRWHLELNADQPGCPGYEGQRWTPCFGFGRINARRVFDPVPITTRLRGQPVDIHGFSGAVLANAASANFSFTTSDPVPWTVVSPPWLSPNVAGGTGPSALGFSIDGTGLSVGTYTGSVVIDAPSAVDGGASLPATVHTHRDERIGDVITVGSTFHEDSWPPYPPPVIIGDGLGALIVWAEEIGSPELYAARVDGGGNSSGPYVLHSTYPPKEEVALAFDGRNYLVVWEDTVPEYHVNSYRETNSVKALRVAPSGDVLDAAPIVLTARRSGRNVYLSPCGVAFDGEAYTVCWAENNSASNVGKVYVRRVGPDGTIRSKAQKVYPAAATLLADRPWHIRPQLACANGTCLLAWEVRDGEVDPDGRYVDKVYGVRLNGDEVIDSAAFRILTGSSLLTNIATNGTDYMILADRFTSVHFAVGARVTASGEALDPNGFRVDTGPGEPNGFPRATGLAFDGTNYIATFLGGTSVQANYIASLYGGGYQVANQIFANRIGPDGRVLDNEMEGLLVVDAGPGDPTAGLRSSVASTPTHSIVVWTDSFFDDPLYPWRNQIYAQRIFGHASLLPTVAIGSIGGQTVAERVALVFTVDAPALNPAATTFTASNLPPGALFDVPTHTFRWMPAGNEAGTYPAVHFEATDGVQTVSEDITITVSEARLSLGGTVRFADGAPAPSVAIRLKSATREKRYGFTDAYGRFRFDDVAPGEYRLSLTRPSTKEYQASPRVRLMTVESTDASNADFVVTAR